jgi:hypothetical protein
MINFNTKGAIKIMAADGRSLMIALDAITMGHVGMMPVQRDDIGNYRALATRAPITIEPAP